MQAWTNPFSYSNVRPNFCDGKISVELAYGKGFDAMPVSTTTYDRFNTRDALGWNHRHNAFVVNDFQGRQKDEASKTVPSAEELAAAESSHAFDDDDVSSNADWMLQGWRFGAADKQSNRAVLATRLFNPMDESLIVTEIADSEQTARAQREDEAGNAFDPWRRLGSLQVGKADVSMKYGIYDRSESGVWQDSFAIVAPLASVAEFVGMLESANPEAISRILVAAAQKISDEMFPSQLRVNGGNRFRDLIQLGRAGMVRLSDLPEYDENNPKTFDDSDAYPGLLAQAAVLSTSSESEVPSQKMIRVNLESGDHGRRNVRIIVERPKLDQYGAALALRGAFREWVQGRLEPRATVVTSQLSLDDLLK